MLVMLSTAAYVVDLWEHQLWNTQLNRNKQVPESSHCSWHDEEEDHEHGMYKHYHHSNKLYVTTSSTTS